MTQDRDKLKLSAILSADVVGYSRLMEADRAWTIKSLEENKKLIGDLVKEYKGRVVDAPGDNLLAEFSSITNAVECAVKIQKELQKKNSKLMENHRMEFRIGINLGEVFEEDGRIYGSGVNIAARIEGLSRSGGICISGRTYDHIKTEFDFGYEFLGEHIVKNISEPIRVYRVLTDFDSTGKIIREKKPISLFSQKTVMTTIISIIVILVGLFIWKFYQSQPEGQIPKTIAVLPFDDLSPEKNQEHFVLGLSEEILNSLTQIPELTVIAKTSSFSFRGTNKKIQEIASELGADHILEGSVRKYGDTIRITAQLIKADDESHLWSETYDKDLDVKEILTVQEDIANNVADKLKLTLEAFQLLGGTESVDAYELYLNAKGRIIDVLDVSVLESALHSIEETIDLDPEFALAWVFKSLIHGELAAIYSSDIASSELDLALEMSQKAIELEPRLEKAYFSMGSVFLAMGEFTEAEKVYRKGMDLTNEIDGTLEIVWYHLVVGQLKKHYDLLEEIRKSDPLNPDISLYRMFILGALSDFEGAEKEYELGKSKFTPWSVGDLFIDYIRIGANDVITSDKLNKIPIGTSWPVLLANLNSPENGIMELREIYNNKNLSNAELINIGLGAAYFGHYDFAMEAIERSASINVSRLFKIWLPIFDEVRKTPRFKKFAREIGFVDYWKEYGWPDLCRPIGEDDFECD